MKAFFGKRLIFIIVTFIVLAITSLGIIQFRSALSSEIADSAEGYLFETSNLYASTFRIKLNDQLIMLESQARYFENVDLTDYNLMKSTIMSTKGIGDFKRIAIADSSGTTMNYDGKSSGNIMMKDYFKNAMRGETNVSSKITVDEDGEKVLVLAVPIMRNGEAVGVITGTFGQSVLRNLFEVETFGGEGYFYVINADGTIIVSNDNKNKLMSDDNVYEFFSHKEVVTDISSEAFKRDVITGVTGIMHYTYGTQERIIVYSPVELHDWYVISAMPSNVVSSQTNAISRLVTLLFMFFLLMIALTGVFVTLLVRRSKAIEKDNERFRIVNTQTQSIVFEYDLVQEKLELTGNTDFLFEGGKKVFVGKKCSEVLNRIHKDDLVVMQQLHKFFRGESNTFSSEIRLLCVGDGYRWFRVQGSLIRNGNGEVIKFIGNGVNVDQQMVEELNLKTKAERDLLTGLLNKLTFEDYVNDSLRAAQPSCIYAFFIIDLDNFKAVNDRMGHAMGDKVLTNVGINLSRVFSEQDLLGRIGGDEFAVLLIMPKSAAGIAHQIALTKAEKLLSGILHTYSDEKESVTVSASIGISFFDIHGKQYDSLYKNADKALYCSKENGKNRFTVYDETLGE